MWPMPWYEAAILIVVILIEIKRDDHNSGYAYADTEKESANGTEIREN